MSDKALLCIEVRDLHKHFPVQRGWLRRTVGWAKAVGGVSFAIRTGETLGLVGESGCGKTTLGRSIVRLYEPTGGEVLMRRDGKMVSVTALDKRELRRFRRHMQTIFQDPYGSLNPRMTALDIVGEPLFLAGMSRGRALEDRVAEVFQEVGLRPEHLRRYPHSFSGGQRQRISIARALVVQPEFVVADEPVSALDVSIQAQILNLLKRLQRQWNLTYLFISHDLAVVRYISNRIGVMYAGKLVELAPRDEILFRPQHPYTEMLLNAVPRTEHRQLLPLKTGGQPPHPAHLPLGCVFHPRCPYALDICKVDMPPLREVRPGHFAACHLSEELKLSGVKELPVVGSISATEGGR